MNGLHCKNQCFSPTEETNTLCDLETNAICASRQNKYKHVVLSLANFECKVIKTSLSPSNSLSRGMKWMAHCDCRLGSFHWSTSTHTNLLQSKCAQEAHHFHFDFWLLIPPLWLFSKTLHCVWHFHSATLISNSVKHDLLLPFIRKCLGPARVRIELQYEVLNYAEWGQ